MSQAVSPTNFGLQHTAPIALAISSTPVLAATSLGSTRRFFYRGPTKPLVMVRPEKLSVRPSPPPHSPQPAPPNSGRGPQAENTGKVSLSSSSMELRYGNNRRLCLHPLSTPLPGRLLHHDRGSPPATRGRRLRFSAKHLALTTRGYCHTQQNAMRSVVRMPINSTLKWRAERSVQ